jgi:altronate dehydratase large subunit
MGFLGYRRANGTAGIRNYVLVLPGGLISSKICEFVNGTRTLISADSGSGRSKRDRETIARVITGLGKNPNVAGVIMHSISLGAGYPELNPEAIATEIGKTGKPVEFISSKKYPDALNVIERGIRVARQMVRDASHIRREPVDDSKLAIGVKCGRSDPTSGMAGNPVMGQLFNHVVKAGGTAFFGETTEIIGAEHILAKRAVNKKVAQDIINAALATEERGKRCGEAIRNINPVPANIAAGISTLEEKSLGAIVKSGDSPIQGVLSYAESPPTNGLYFVDNWQEPTSIFLGYIAAGATLVLYQMGGGGRLEDTLLSPWPTVVAPELVTTANYKTYAACGESVDLYTGTVIEGKQSIEQAGEELYDLVRQVASGSMTKTETIKFQDAAQCYLQDTPF